MRHETEFSTLNFLLTNVLGICSRQMQWVGTSWQNNKVNRNKANLGRLGGWVS